MQLAVTRQNVIWFCPRISLGNTNHISMKSERKKWTNSKSVYDAHASPIRYDALVSWLCNSVPNMNTEHVLPFNSCVYTVFLNRILCTHFHYIIYPHHQFGWFEVAHFVLGLNVARVQCHVWRLLRLHHTIVTASEGMRGSMNAIFILFLFDAWQRNTYSAREKREKKCKYNLYRGLGEYICIDDCDVVKQKIKCICNVANGECVLLHTEYYRVDWVSILQLLSTKKKRKELKKRIIFRWFASSHSVSTTI